jgi:transcriptional regulator MraZ
MIIGQYETQISEKRRIAIPKKLRDFLGQKMIIAKWYEECLVLVSNKSWNALLNRLTGKSQIVTSPVRDTDRFILGSAFEVMPDTQGRVIVPAILAKYAELTGEVLFIGLGDRVEIWSKEKWIKREEYVAGHAAEFVEKLGEDEKK